MCQTEKKYVKGKIFVSCFALESNFAELKHQMRLSIF